VRLKGDTAAREQTPQGFTADPNQPTGIGDQAGSEFADPPSSGG
jgi:hypothetical protein